MTETHELLAGRGIGRVFGRGKARQAALRDVDIDVRPGECLAIIGGSGSGKSTLARILLGLDRPDSGTVTYRGEPVDGPRSQGYRLLRRESGLVFQDPFASLDPRWRVERSVGEPLRIQHHGIAGDELRDKVADALDLVGLDAGEFMGRYPADLSGGQAQRVAIARAVVAGPSLIVADEPMSAIDVAARLRILEAFATIRKARPETAIVMISHDLGVVQHIAERIVVLHDGSVVETGPCDEVLGHPKSDYARQLVAAASL
ncbi:dipeptide/oligopeptide/nickel ABC transporter ATP-binding protein [Bifidobacterium sp. ESL0763]|uniref:ABC transporter ATP-binding protein n=1 Tax=Bifidobacterium sp. ESL0763 TaxID=2983227 RepID=UPI0023F74265|nr:dipeptide/oligopeptide/nickel ABC transporter ATP-binding protein [Bifidobacterium sp. ESL0763]MDF7663600.1 dipeptide/oligopeptide/nickel ABC transporter ATP-binding protein [Bifidobacterium sp. ESL0763]